MGLFGGGKPASTETKIPEYLKDRYEDTWAKEDEMFDMAKGIAGGMGPREILGMNDMEKGGFLEAMKGLGFSEDFLAEAGNFGGIDSALGGKSGMLDAYRNFDSGYDDLAGGGHYGKIDGMDDYWDLGQDAGQSYDDLMGKAGGMNGDPLKDWSTDRIGDKSLDDMRQSYESQYTDDVVDTTLQGSDRQRARDRLNNQLASTAQGGTSNSRSAIAQAVGDSIYGQTRAGTEAQLRDQAFNNAAQLGQAEAALGQKEDQMNYDFLKGGMDFDKDMLDFERLAMGDKYTQQGNLMGDYLDKEMSWQDKGAQWDKGLLDSKNEYDYKALDSESGIWDDLLEGEKWRQGANRDLAKDWTALGTAKGGLMSGFGEANRGLNQRRSDEIHTNDMDNLGWLSGILNSQKGDKPSGVGTTTQNEAKQGFGSTLLGLGQAAAGAWLSDENAKEDIVDFDGDALDQVLSLDVKEYRYRDDAPGHRSDRHAGLIAQDLEAKVPNSTYVGDDGLKRVDPYSVSATIVKAVQQLNKKIDASVGGSV